MAHDLGDPPAAPRPRTRKERDAAARARLVGSLSELADVGVRAVRLQYADLHGICRGKLIPISAFPHVAEEGMGFVEAIMTVDLRHNVVAGFEHGFPDLLARPDLDTLVPLPWEEDVVACLVDLEDPVTARATSARLPGGFEAGAGPVLRVRGISRGGAGARVLPDGAGSARIRAAGVRMRGRTARSTRSVTWPTRRGRSRGCSTPRSSSSSARSPPPTNTAAASSRSTSSTPPRSTRATARSASARWSRRWRRSTGCSRRSWASRSTTTRGRLPPPRVAGRFGRV